MFMYIMAVITKAFNFSFFSPSCQYKQTQPCYSLAHVTALTLTATEHILDIRFQSSYLMVYNFLGGIFI